MKELKQRIRGEYVETVPDCELIPNQTYKLSGLPVTVIQPEVAGVSSHFKFIINELNY